MKFILSFGIIVLLITSCTQKDKYAQNVKNTYYIEISADTAKLKDTLITLLDGKASFTKDNKLQVVSMNYLTETYPDIHYFILSDKLPKEIEKGTLKIALKITGKMSTDSTVYSFPRYMYNGKDWQKVSDIGPIQMMLDVGLLKREKFRFDDLLEKIRMNVINSTYN